jgi:tripartite-type tricarboxylate transporter receptor subunit TctC
MIPHGPRHALGLALTLLASIALASLAADPARADDEALARFYNGRQMSVIVYSEAGSTYDLYARLLARHMGKHIPGNPTLIPQNMPGAGGLKATEFLYSMAPKNGTVFGTISRSIPFETLLGVHSIPFDPLKVVWLGSMNRESAVAVAWHTVPVKTVDDLRARELIVPGTGAGSDTELLPRAFNELIGTRFKVISGYSGSTRASLAMERGEVEGAGYITWGALTTNQPGWVRDKMVTVLFRTGAGDDPRLSGVPDVRSLARNDTDRQALDLILAREILGRPFLAPPGLPDERARALTSAFAASVADPDLLADAKKARADIDPVSGDEVVALLKRVYEYPEATIARAKEALTRAR